MNRWERLAGYFLAVLMLFSIAHADRAYIPGEITGKLLRENLPEGTLLGSLFTFSLEMTDPLPEGFSSETSLALSRLLSSLEIYMAIGKTADGPRFEWAAQYSGVSGKKALLDLSLTANRERVFIESNLIEGKRFTARWRTLLAKLDLPEIDTDLLLSGVPNSFFSELTSTTKQLSPLLSPYIACFMDWKSSLSQKTRMNVPSEGIFPAAAHEVETQISEAEIADLLSRIAELLIKDEELPAFWNNYNLSMYMAYPGPKVAESLSNMAERFVVDDEPSLLLFTAATDEYNAPLYWILEEKLPDSSDYNGAALILGYDVEQDAHLLHVSIGSRIGEQIKAPLDSSISLHQDASNPRVFLFKMNSASEIENTAFYFEAEYGQTALSDDRGPYGYEFSSYEDAIVQEGESQREGAERTTLQYYLTDAGGEEADLLGRFVVMEGETILHQGDYETEFYIEPNAGSFSVWGDLFLSIESLGIKDLSIAVNARPSALNAAVQDLDIVSLEENTEAASALLTEAAQNILALSSDFLSALPEDDRLPLLRLFSPEEYREDPDKDAAEE